MPKSKSTEGKQHLIYSSEGDSNNYSQLPSDNRHGSEILQAANNADASLNIQNNSRDEIGPPSSSNQIDGSCQDINCGDSNDIIPPWKKTEAQANYSVNKVRYVLVLSAIFSSVNSTASPLIAQYLLDRWSDEDGHSHQQNHSVPDRGLCNKNESDPWVIKDDAVQSRVSMATMYYSFATCFPALLSCLIYGALVDIVGRRPALISTLVGYTCKLTFVICIIRFNLDPDFFYLAYACDGIGGGFYTNLIACFSITADISEQKNTRILGIAILTVIGQCTYAASNVAVGLLIKKVGYVAASSVILAPVAFSLIFTVIFLPETLPMPKQRLTFRKLWAYTARIVSLYSRDGDRRMRLSLVLSLLIFFTSVVNSVNLSTIDTLYQRHEPLCWDSVHIGYYSAFQNAGTYFVALIYLCICRCIGCANDEVLAMIGMLFMAGSFVLEAFVRNSWQMYMVSILMIPGSNLAPITRGVMSILAGPDKQGVLFSSIALIEVMCSLAATVVYNKIYAITVVIMPGFVYLVMAGVALVTFMLYIPFFHFYDGPPRSYETLIQSQDSNDDSSIHSSASSDGEVA